MATKVYKPKRKISATESEEIKIPASSVDGLSTVATSGSYNDLSNKPTIPDVSGLMPKAGGTFTGGISAPNISTGTDAANYFQTQRFRGEGNADTYYHAVDFGFAGHNQVDFHEYGGLYNFYQNTGGASNTCHLVGAFTPDGIKEGETLLKDKYALKTDIPTIPTVNNGTLTIQKNGTDVATFTANQSTNVTANITVPTKVSELENDSGYTTNKGTVTQVKINGTTKSPDSTGLVDLGTVSGSSDNSKFDYTVLTNEDLNTVIEAGRYRAEKGNTCKHRPFILTAPAFFLTVEKTESGSITQTAYLTAGEPSSYYEWYVRYSTNNGSSWYSWRKQQSIDERYSQAFGGTKTFSNIDITNSLEFNGSSGSSSQFAMSQGSSSAPKWVNLQVRVNGTTYTADSSGLIDLGEISGGGSASQYNDIY